MKDEKLELLVLEDEKSAKEALEFILKPKYKVQFATRCQEAIQKFDQDHFDVVLLDLKLPDGNGADILKHIRQNKPDQEVIVISANEDVQGAIEIMKLGASDYLLKPVNKETLLKSIGKIEKNMRLSWEKTVLLQKVQDSENRYHGIIGQSLAIRHICETIAKLKGTETYILLMGEKRSLPTRYTNKKAIL